MISSQGAGYASFRRPYTQNIVRISELCTTLNLFKIRKQCHRQFDRIVSLLQAALAASGRKGGAQAAIVLGLSTLTTKLLGRAWQRDACGELRIDRCLVDSGFATPTVYEFCARSPFASILMPSKGLGVLAGSMPITEYKAKPGQRAPGFHTPSINDSTGHIDSGVGVSDRLMAHA